ncbi:MAG TPA: hypothetical protein VKQ32_10125 [Polyangia bacterium]|nr:hypothetical protein [Polyangia bacterium]
MTWKMFAPVVGVVCCLSLEVRAVERPGVGGIVEIAELPGWWKAGSNPVGYQVGVDRTVMHAGRASARLNSVPPDPSGFGSLMQVASADKFHGKRIRMSGWVKAENVKRSAGLWMRVDGPSQDPKQSLAFDAMNDRKINGTRAWQRYEIVLDVPNDATDIAFGATLSGAGAIWIDDIRFEEVGRDVPTTAPPPPRNLDFETRAARP